MTAFAWAVLSDRQLLREANADRDALQGRYDIACEIIANHLEGTHGNTDRARAMVEKQYRLRHGPIEEPQS